MKRRINSRVEIRVENRLGAEVWNRVYSNVKWNTEWNAKWAVNQSQLFKFVLIVNHLLFVTLSATGDWIRLEVLHATHVAARSDGGFV